MAKQELIVAGFSYEGMDKDTEGKLRSLARDLTKHKTAFVMNVIAIGDVLCTAHEQFANQRNGSFLRWVEFEAGFSKSSAYNYMAAFKVFGKLPIVGRIEDTALYALAHNDTPEKARKEVLKLADSGVKVTQKQAKQIIKKYSTSAAPSSSPASPPPTSVPPKPEPTKEELLKLEIKKARSYTEGLIRALDDVNGIKRNTVVHPQLLKLCGQILEGLGRW